MRNETFQQSCYRKDTRYNDLTQRDSGRERQRERESERK